MSLSLVAFDTDRIKDYVFAGDALRDIRGASSILDRLNREQMPGLVGGTLAFAAGGSALFALPSPDADAAIARVQRAYADASAGAATITGVQLPLPDGFDLEQSDIRPLWRLLGERLAAAKSRNPLFLTSVSHPLIRYDAVDEMAYASHRDPNAGLISTASRRKRVRSQELATEASIRGESRPETFEEIAGHSQPAGYFALIVADGDRMGHLLESCQTFGALRDTANTLYQIIARAVSTAITRQGLTSAQYDKLILGGDDIVLAVPAQHALPIAKTLVEEFARSTAADLGRPLTLSAAVVWAHMRYPFAVWRELAESALRFAKREAARQDLPGGLINFLVVSSANHLEFAEYHREVLTTREDDLRRVVRSMRPYTPERLQLLLDARLNPRQRKKQGDDRIMLGDVPRSKLAALNRAVFLPSYRQAMLDSLKILVHWRGASSRQAVEDLVARLGEVTRRELSFPFALQREFDADLGVEREVYTTPLADLAEIWDFLPGGNDAHTS